MPRLRETHLSTGSEEPDGNETTVAPSVTTNSIDRHWMNC